jgi:hypothetical protein
MYTVKDYTTGKTESFGDIGEAVNYQEHLIFNLGHDAEVL